MFEPVSLKLQVEKGARLVLQKVLELIMVKSLTNHGKEFDNKNLLIFIILMALNTNFLHPRHHNKMVLLKQKLGCTRDGTNDASCEKHTSVILDRNGKHSSLFNQ